MGSPGLLSAAATFCAASITSAGIETVGIGIQTEAVSRFYKQHVVVSNLEDLATSALDKLCKILLDGVIARA